MSLIQCMTCGGMTEVGDRLHGTCEYCGCSIALKRVSSFNGISMSELPHIRQIAESGSNEPEDAPSDLVLALCYLKAENFILAKKILARLIENQPECCEAYYYYALTVVNGRTLGEISMSEAREITQYLKTAIALDASFVLPRLFFAVLCLDYYEFNELRPPADGEAILDELAQENVDEQELDFFIRMVNTQIL